MGAAGAGQRGGVVWHGGQVHEMYRTSSCTKACMACQTIRLPTHVERGSGRLRADRLRGGR